VIAFNERNGIVDCISSILNQNVKESKVNIAILVVDDGSTDGTAELVEESFTSKVKVLRQENSGRGLARSKGIESAETSLIAMVDSDIRLPIDWLNICLKNLESNAGVGGIAVPDGDCATIHRIFHLSPKLKKGSINVNGSNALFRTDALRDSGQNWVTPLGEDFRLSEVLQIKGYKLKRIDNLVVQHIESKTYSESLKWLYESGVDATRLWLEFKITRIPDIAAVFFLGSVISIPILIPFFGLWSFLHVLILVLLTGLSHLVSKFYFHKNTLSFFAAWLPNSVLMLSYYLGRIYGIISLFRIRIGKVQNEYKE
jgi:cellulose synthase/poly-beta-1,6-N-acetylglucosamine synthase-like glycosyltransferase